MAIITATRMPEWHSEWHMNRENEKTKHVLRFQP